MYEDPRIYGGDARTRRISNTNKDSKLARKTNLKIRRRARAHVCNNNKM